MDEKKEEHITRQVERIKARAEELGINSSCIETLLEAGKLPSCGASPTETLKALEEMMLSVQPSTDSKYFDEAEFVDEEILPLWEKIFRLCEERAIPTLFVAMRGNSEDGASTVMGNVSIKGRTDDRLVLAKALLEGKGVPLQMPNDALIGALSAYKDMMGAEADCDCKDCIAERAKRETPEA